ncbi:MAG: hypothetical protein ACRD1P_07500 [Thermoanaerobaculia bacterium]
MDRETADEIERQFSVVAEGLRSEIRTVAEGLVATNEKIDRLESRITEELNEIKAMIRLSFGELDRVFWGFSGGLFLGVVSAFFWGSGLNRGIVSQTVYNSGRPDSRVPLSRVATMKMRQPTA